MTISFNLAPGAAGDATKAIEQIGRTRNALSIQASFRGTAQAFKRRSRMSRGSFSRRLWQCISLWAFSGFIHPITILSTLPSVGAILALLLFRTELGVVALIGVILLIGIVKKNAIMMIDFALDAGRNESKPPEEAIYERAAPLVVVMTTFAALFGGLPLALEAALAPSCASLWASRRGWVARESGAHSLHHACHLSFL